MRYSAPLDVDLAVVVQTGKVHGPPQLRYSFGLRKQLEG
jgi:hypothetical protein